MRASLSPLHSLFALGAFLAGWAPAQLPEQVTTRVSVSSSGAEGNYSSGGNHPSIGRDGRFVAFASGASNLTPSDAGILSDVFIHDRSSGVTELVSLSSAGIQSNGVSFMPCVSTDGSIVAFYSDATNLVPNDTNGTGDIFVHDRNTGKTERVSVSSSGVEGSFTHFYPTMTPDGRYVAFSSLSMELDPSDSDYYADVFIHDRLAGTTEVVSTDTFGSGGNNHSSRPSLSADGRFVAFKSDATNLVPFDTNGAADYFVKDRLTGFLTRVSVDSSGAEMNDPVLPIDLPAPSLSDDGRFIAFQSHGTNLVPGDTNGEEDIFVHDRIAGTTERISVDSFGGQATFPIAVPPHKNSQAFPRISGDGRHVVFESTADNLVPNDFNNKKDVFVHDRSTGLTERVNIHDNAIESNELGLSGAVSESGRFVCFHSGADNLVLGDTNGFGDVFVHDRMTGGPELQLGNVVAGQAATFTITGAAPGGLVFVGFSLVGQGPLPSAWGPLELGSLDLVLPFLADGAGQISTQMSLPPGLAGLPLLAQGIDLTLDFPTSVWGGLIQ